MNASALLSVLRHQREHVLGTVDGLSDADLRRPVLPSGWSCLSLLRHLTLDVEVFWFRAVVAGEAGVISRLDGLDAWDVPDDTSTASVIAAYRDACDTADRIVCGSTPDRAPAWWPDFFGDYRLNTVGEVVVHVLVETCTHAGHLDAARELIDGRQWLVLT